jgi:hypothetical protein
MLENIRSIDGLDDTELRTSLKTASWNKQLPAIKDEYGVVLVGHRRLKIAAEENIVPVIKIVTFGDGPDADAERMRLAVVSNVGAAPLTKEDRKSLAERLYDSGRGLTMEAIAGIVGVSTMTVSNDLRELLKDFKSSKSDRGTDKLGRPRSTGRPKKPRLTPTLDRAVEIVRPLVEAGLPLKKRELQDEHGISHTMFDSAVASLKGEKKAREEPLVDPETLKLSDKKRFEFAVKQHQKKLDLQFEQRVLAEIKKRMDEMILPHWKEQIKEAEKLYEKRQALMSKDLFNTIRRALHPDSRNSISDDKLGAAFDAFMGLEKYLLNEKDSPTKFEYSDGSGLPRDFADWEKRRAKSTRRPSSGNSMRPRS